MQIFLTSTFVLWLKTLLFSISLTIWKAMKPVKGHPTLMDLYTPRGDVRGIPDITQWLSWLWLSAGNKNYKQMMRNMFRAIDSESPVKTLVISLSWNLGLQLQICIKIFHQNSEKPLLRFKTTISSAWKKSDDAEFLKNTFSHVDPGESPNCSNVRTVQGKKKKLLELQHVDSHYHDDTIVAIVGKHLQTIFQQHPAIQPCHSPNRCRCHNLATMTSFV